MGQKDTIISLLKQQGEMTQGAHAEAMYGDRNHMPSLYASLMTLVKTGIVNRTGENQRIILLIENRVYFCHYRYGEVLNIEKK